MRAKRTFGNLTLVSVVAILAMASFADGVPCRDGLANPERGYRFELKIGREAGDPVPKCMKGGEWPFAAYAKDGVTVAQAYCYLDRYCDSSIPQSKLEALQASFDRARKDGVKFLLRFAYERDMSRLKGPTLARILMHIHQLTPAVKQNADVIYALQIGWVGAWGEFHSSAHGIENDVEAAAKVVQYTYDYMLPQNRFTMMRTMQWRENVAKVLGTSRTRIGLFNDATLADFHDSTTFMGDREELMKLPWDELLVRRYSVPGNPQFDELCRIGAHLPVDGELFWKDNVDWAHQNGLMALVRLRRHHYTTLSLVHGNSELDGGKGIGPIDTWRKTPVTAELLDSFQIPFDPAYFAGVPYRTAYEYIRDHLGYRLVAKSCTVTGGRVRVTLHNHGFAAPINPRKAYFAVVGTDDHVKEIPTDVDCRTFNPEEDAIVEAAVPELKDGEHLALWLPDEDASIRLRPEYAIRLAGGAKVETRGGYLLNMLEP